MANNPVQFQPGLSLTKFLDEYGTEPEVSKGCEQPQTAAPTPRISVY